MKRVVSAMSLRSATRADCDRIAALIARCAALGAVLVRDRAEIEAWIEGFVVAEVGDTLLGCAALQAYSAGVAEVRSVAVSPDARGLGAGAELLRFVEALADQMEIETMFLLTMIPAFFRRFGFNDADRVLDVAVPWDRLRLGGRLTPGKSVMVRGVCRPVPVVQVPARVGSGADLVCSG